MTTIQCYIKYCALWSLCACLIVACSDTSDDDWGKGNDTIANVNRNDTSHEPALARLEFPHAMGGSLMLIHTTNDQYGINYSVEWDIEKRAPRWSAYQMHAGLKDVKTSRYQGGYPSDPLLPYSYNPDGDLIKGSGFDHGHICPSADRLYSNEANYQTFFLTNMQPQYKAFNGSLQKPNDYKNKWSPWYRLEDQVRSWGYAATTDTLYVVKGGTIEDNQVWMKDKLRVPKYFFVALLMKNKGGYKAVGFWMEHVSDYGMQEPLSAYAVSISDLERLTGIDFFCNLPDDIENRVETLPIDNIKRAWGL